MSYQVKCAREHGNSGDLIFSITLPDGTTKSTTCDGHASAYSAGAAIRELVESVLSGLSNDRETPPGSSPSVVSTRGRRVVPQ